MKAEKEAAVKSKMTEMSENNWNMMDNFKMARAQQDYLKKNF